MVESYTAREILEGMQDVTLSTRHNKPSNPTSPATIEYYRCHPEDFSSTERELLDKGLAIVTATLVGSMISKDN
jgi:hypothetical protein